MHHMAASFGAYGAPVWCIWAQRVGRRMNCKQKGCFGLHIVTFSHIASFVACVGARCVSVWPMAPPGAVTQAGVTLLARQDKGGKRQDGVDVKMAGCDRNVKRMCQINVS